MSLFSKIKEFFFPQKKEGKKVFVNKDGINKVIYESELKDYLSKGYTRGRTKNK
jgi:hypothetical protein